MAVAARIALGCSPLAGADHSGSRSAEYRDRFAQAERVSEVWDAFRSAGGRALHLVDDARLWAAWQTRASLQDCEIWLSLGTGPWEPWLPALATRAGSRAIMDARAADAGEPLDEFAKRARDYGVRPWVATRRPAALFRSRRDLHHVEGVLLPFNPAGVLMDGTPDTIARLARERVPHVVAAMPLGAGAVRFPDGIAYAAMRFPDVVAGTGSAEHAEQIARLEPHLPLLAHDVPLRRTAAAGVDIAAYPDEVILTRDHRCLTFGGAAVRVWDELATPRTLAGIISTVAETAPPQVAGPALEAAIAGLVLRLAVWGVVERAWP